MSDKMLSIFSLAIVGIMLMMGVILEAAVHNNHVQPPQMASTR